jgi:ribonuclease J
MTKKKTTLTFYGGVNEIGGNKVLLKDKNTKVFLDFGMSFALKRQYYSAPFLSPKSEKSLLEFGILPDLRGVYEFDDSEPEIDGVLLSHSHMDHAAYISFLKRSIPVYCGETTATILTALNEMRTGFEYDIDGIQFKTFRTGDKIKIGSMEIEPIHVDHSVPGAYGFVIHTSSGTVVYTGDFRLHGTKPEMTEEFVEKAEEAEPVATIPEGTNMTSSHFSSEPEVEKKLTRIIEQTSGLVLADFARADIDRLRSFFHAAKKNRRQLAITLRQAYVLSRLCKDPHLGIPNLNDKNILVFQKAKKHYYKWEQEILDFEDVVDSSEIGEMQEEVILVTSFYDLEELVDIKPAPGSCHILSASEPINEEMETDFNKLISWLEHYGLPQYHVHVSGHIMPLQLKQILKAIDPKKIYPIHGEHPELFSKFLRDLDSEILAVERGEEYVL